MKRVILVLALIITDISNVVANTAVVDKIFPGTVDTGRSGTYENNVKQD